MIFFNILLLNFLLQPIFCEEDGECDFKTPETVSTIVEKMAKPSKGLLNKFIDFDLADSIGIDLEDKGIDINNYIYDAGSFGAIFLVFFVLFFLYFFFFCVTNCCCCCHAKNAKKPNASLIIFHIIGIALLVITAIFIFLSSSSVIKAFDKIKNFPSNLNNEIDGIFDKLDSTVSNTFDTADRNVDNFILILENFTNWLSNSSEANNESAYQVIPLISSYNDTFAENGKPYMDNFEKLINENSLETNLKKDVELMNYSRQPAVDTIINLSQTLVDAMTSISETADNIQETANTSILTVKEQIEEVRNSDDVNGEINKLRDSLNGSSLDMEMLEDICETVGPILKIVYYVIAAFILLIAILYISIFFCHNCFSRCVACCFPLCGFILNIIIIFPGCVFAIGFILFNNLCPDLEDTISSIVNPDESDSDDYYKTLLYTKIFSNKASYKFSSARALDSESSDSLFNNLTEILLCEHDTPLIDLLGLDFDTDTILDQFKEQVKDLTGFEIPSGLTDKLTGFAEDFSVEENISSNYILLNHNQTLGSIQKLGPPISAYAKEMSDIINNEEPTLDKVRGYMSNIIEFGSSIVPETEDLNNRTQQLVEQLTQEANEALNNGLDSITCKPFKCVYSPFKNMLCVDLLAGFAFWVLSTIFSIVGLAILSITVCRRRRSMAKSKVQNSDSDSDDDDESASSVDDSKDDDSKNEDSKDD